MPKNALFFFPKSCISAVMAIKVFYLVLSLDYCPIAVMYKNGTYPIVIMMPVATLRQNTDFGNVYV